jgi:hypothetical protein
MANSQQRETEFWKQQIGADHPPNNSDVKSLGADSLPHPGFPQALGGTTPAGRPTGTQLRTGNDLTAPALIAPTPPAHAGRSAIEQHPDTGDDGESVEFHRE